MKHALLILALTLFVTENIYSQDPVFSQFYTSPMFLNPALSGLERDVVFGVNYRTQWAGVNLPFRTFQFSAIRPIIQQGVSSKHLGAFAGSAFTDEAGPNREIVSQGFSLASSYNFHLDRTGKNLLSAGLQLGVLQRRANLDALQWSSQYSALLGYDPSLPGEKFLSDRVTTPVINAGLVWRLVVDDRIKPLSMYYQGVAFANLNRPRGFFEDTHEPSSILVKVHGGYVHAFGSGFEISPNYFIQYQKMVQVNLGAYGAYTVPHLTSKSLTGLKLSAGLWYRIRDSFIVTSGIITPAWSAGFSYDTNHSSLSRNFPGANAFEFSFSYRINITREYGSFATPLF
ncbi:MAG TPA: PorP/SprF family type IX secretion system membrane protein [Chryseosolibacter sp.]